MSTNPLDLIEARAQAATKGPWEVPHSCDQHLDKVEAPNDDNLAGPICEVRSPQPNAVFIAAARTDVEKMAKALRAVEAVHVIKYYDKWGRSSSTYSPDGQGGWCDSCGRINGEKCPTVTAIREVLG